MKVAYRVQSCPGREQVRERLCRALPDPEVIVDDGERTDTLDGPWRGYRRCLTDLPDCSHLVVIQDDAVVCRNFPLAVTRLAEAHPDTVVCLFVPGSAKRTMLAMRRSRAPLVPLHRGDFLPVVGVLWPVEQARAFMEWDWVEAARKAGIRLPARSDDALAGLWQRSTQASVLATRPSLVQHPDDTQSSVSHRPPRSGLDAGRVAAMWIGDDDPLEIDWSPE